MMYTGVDLKWKSAYISNQKRTERAFYLVQFSLKVYKALKRIAVQKIVSLGVAIFPLSNNIAYCEDNLYGKLDIFVFVENRFLNQ